VPNLILATNGFDTHGNRYSSGDFRFYPDFVGSTLRNGPSKWCRRKTRFDPQRSFRQSRLG